MARAVASGTAGSAAAAGRPALEIRNVSLAFASSAGPRTILDDISFDVVDGETLCLVGPSGCGKTTILRLLAGLLSPTRGVIRFEGTPIAGPSRERAIVFQDYTNALLPWRTVAGNVALSLEARNVPRTQQARSSTRCCGKWDCSTPRSNTPASFPAGCSSACRSPAASPSSPRSC
jgi:NitT/TauT family transport system ATP-binding protein